VNLPCPVRVWNSDLEWESNNQGQKLRWQPTPDLVVENHPVVPHVVTVQRHGDTRRGRGFLFAVKSLLARNLKRLNDKRLAAFSEKNVSPFVKSKAQIILKDFA